MSLLINTSENSAQELLYHDHYEAQVMSVRFVCSLENVSQTGSGFYVQARSAGDRYADESLRKASRKFIRGVYGDFVRELCLGRGPNVWGVGCLQESANLWRSPNYGSTWGRSDSMRPNAARTT